MSRSRCALVPNCTREKETMLQFGFINIYTTLVLIGTRWWICIMCRYFTHKLSKLWSPINCKLRKWGLIDPDVHKAIGLPRLCIQAVNTTTIIYIVDKENFMIGATFWHWNRNIDEPTAWSLLCMGNMGETKSTTQWKPVTPQCVTDRVNHIHISMA